MTRTKPIHAPRRLARADAAGGRRSTPPVSPRGNDGRRPHVLRRRAGTSRSTRPGRPTRDRHPGCDRPLTRARPDRAVEKRSTSRRAGWSIDPSRISKIRTPRGAADGSPDGGACKRADSASAGSTQKSGSTCARRRPTRGRCSVRRVPSRTGSVRRGQPEPRAHDGLLTGLNPFTGNPVHRATRSPPIRSPANPFTANAPSSASAAMAHSGSAAASRSPTCGPDLQPDLPTRRPRRRDIRHRLRRPSAGYGVRLIRRDCRDGEPIGIRRSRHRSRGSPLARGSARRHLRRRVPVTGRSSPGDRARRAGKRASCRCGVADGQGMILENDLIGALGRLVGDVEQGQPRRRAQPVLQLLPRDAGRPGCDLAMITELLTETRGTTTTSSWSARPATRRPTGRRTRLRCRTRARGTSPSAR